MVEYYDCDKKIISNSIKIEKIMNEAAIISNAHIVTSCFHQFNPYGVSGVVIIKESHLTIHTWPEYSYAAIDFFTCSNEVNENVGFKYIKKALNSCKYDINKFMRGLKVKIK